jgi:hypothetical protein
VVKQCDVILLLIGQEGIHRLQETKESLLCMTDSDTWFAVGRKRCGQASRVYDFLTVLFLAWEWRELE